MASNIKQDAIIVDIDGTLSNFRHRMHWIVSQPKKEIHEPDNRQFERFNQEAIHDPIFEDVLKIMQWSQLARGETKILLMTGRNDKYKRLTQDWLTARRAPYHRLFMRAYGDNRSDVDVKLDLYNKWVRHTYNVLFVLEDRDKLVDMWRSLDIRCFQVARGEY